MPTYGATVLDHFQNPRNAGVMADAGGIGIVSNPQCGDTTHFYIKVQGDVIIDVRWQSRGCSSTIAATSMASELVKGKTVAEASRVTRQHIVEALGGLPPAKVHSSVLAVDAIRAAIDDWRNRGSFSRRTQPAAHDGAAQAGAALQPKDTAAGPP